MVVEFRTYGYGNPTSMGFHFVIERQIAVRRGLEVIVPIVGKVRMRRL